MHFPYNNRRHRLEEHLQAISGDQANILQDIGDKLSNVTQHSGDLTSVKASNILLSLLQIQGREDRLKDSSLIDACVRQDCGDILDNSTEKSLDTAQEDVNVLSLSQLSGVDWRSRDSGGGNKARDESLREFHCK